MEDTGTDHKRVDRSLQTLAFLALKKYLKFINLSSFSSF
jgi:hypothetical protein